MGNYNVQGLDLLQTRGESQFAGFCVVSSYWAIPICRVLLCLKILGDYNFEALASSY